MPVDGGGPAEGGPLIPALSHPLLQPSTEVPARTSTNRRRYRLF